MVIIEGWKSDRTHHCQRHR